MTTPIASLPMYDWPEIRHETEALWSAISAQFEGAGLAVPETLSDSADGHSHWLDPELLLSQTCGYPFATQLSGKVELLGTPVYAMEGCYGPNYSSAVIVRADDEIVDLKAAKSHRFAYNSEGSLSGFRCLYPLIGDPLQYFKTSTVSGGHRPSVQMIARGDADIAAVDAICWHLLNEVEPQTVRQLRILQWGPLFPALPFITRTGRDDREQDTMRKALKAAIVDSQDKLQILQLQDVELIEPESYAPLAGL